MRRIVGVVTALLIGLAGPASAAPIPNQIVLPSTVTSTEGIAAGRGLTFFVGDLMQGDIYRGNLRTGEVTVLVDAPDAPPPDGRMAVGMKDGERHRLLFVAGGITGEGYVYDAELGDEGEEVVLQLATGLTFVNDVAVTNDAAYFTDSFQPVLYRVPILSNGDIGTPAVIPLSGPAADATGQVNLNGIAATSSGQTLIVAHTDNAALYTVNPRTGDSARIEITKAGLPHSLPNVDGIVLEEGRLWAVQNFLNQVTAIDLAPDRQSGVVTAEIGSPLFNVPTTAARLGTRLALVNAEFGGSRPTQFEVVIFST